MHAARRTLITRVGAPRMASLHRPPGLAVACHAAASLPPGQPYSRSVARTRALETDSIDARHRRARRRTTHDGVPVCVSPLRNRACGMVPISRTNCGQHAQQHPGMTCFTDAVRIREDGQPIGRRALLRLAHQAPPAGLATHPERIRRAVDTDGVRPGRVRSPRQGTPPAHARAAGAQLPAAHALLS